MEDKLKYFLITLPVDQKQKKNIALSEIVSKIKTLKQRHGKNILERRFRFRSDSS